MPCVYLDFMSSARNQPSVRSTSFMLPHSHFIPVTARSQGWHIMAPPTDFTKTRRIISPASRRSCGGSEMEQLYWIPLGIATFIVLYLILGSFFTVRTAEVAVITRFGKFLRVAEPGLNWKRPFFDSVAGTISPPANKKTLTRETRRKDKQVVTHNHGAK